MKHLTEAEKEEILRYVLEKTGASSVLMLLGDSELPCPEELKGNQCKGHKMGILSCNIEDEYMVGLLEEAQDRIVNRNSIKSPFKL